MRIREMIPWRRNEELARTERDPFAALQSEVSRVFDRFFEGFDLGRFGQGENLPRIDVSETDDAVEVTADLPGLTEKDVEVVLANGNLSIRGEKKTEKEEKEKNYHRIERSYGEFHRSVRLPAEVDDKKVDATFANGVLRVVLPKAESAKTTSKRIAIHRPS